MLSPLFPTVSDDLGLSVTPGRDRLRRADRHDRRHQPGRRGTARGVTRRVTLDPRRARWSASPAASSTPRAERLRRAARRPGAARRRAPDCSSRPACRGWASPPARPSAGFAMGIYGVAFSLGLTAAAVLGAIGAGVGWRTPFWVAAGLFAGGRRSASGLADLGPRRRRRGDRSVPWRDGAHAADRTSASCSPCSSTERSRSSPRSPSTCWGISAAARGDAC